VLINASNKTGGKLAAKQITANRVTSLAQAWLKDEMKSPIYRYWLQGAVVLGLLGLIDAAYSGDWSRIGVITKEQELFLQQFAVIAVTGHLGLGVVAGVISSRRGEQWLPRAAKTAAVGFMALLEVILLPDDELTDG
jgi:hypothetical protein